eukprot:GEMP01031480.1.p1 GENE.GEMP01031480.1~~GEMP01031480.1.p1  ORF type:complete len:429 (+),score=92.04 GEMP01031480.1:30-1289(+)
MFTRRVFIMGGHTTPFIGKGHPDFIWKKHPLFGKQNNPNLQQHLKTAVQGALKDTHVNPAEVDVGYVGNFAGELFCQQGHLGASLAFCDPALKHKPSMRVEGACASGGLAATSAVNSIRAGADIALVAGTEVQTSASARDGGLFLARAADFERQASIDDFTFPCLFARRTMHYLCKYVDNSVDDLAKVVEKAYANGNLNPKAHMHKVKISREQAKVNEKNPHFLSNDSFKEYIRLTDCSQVSDGASAIILASEEGVQKAGLKLSDCVEVLGAEYGAGDLFADPEDFTVLDTTKTVVNRLYKNTNRSIKDVHVAEVHDCFSIAEILMYEAIGLAEAGKGTHVIREGITHRDGKLPVNSGGGLISFGHPVGATGVKQLHEVFRQMKNQAGDYQIKNTPSLGLTVNMGGDDKTVVSFLLQNL